MHCGYVSSSEDKKFAEQDFVCLTLPAQRARSAREASGGVGFYPTPARTAFLTFGINAERRGGRRKFAKSVDQKVYTLYERFEDTIQL